MRRLTFLEREESPTRPRAVKKHERRVAKGVGGRRQPASGALPWAKGDVEARELMVSCKRTSKASLRVTSDMLCEIERIALEKGRFPAMAVELGEGNHSERDWVLVPLRHFAELLEASRGR